MAKPYRANAKRANRPNPREDRIVDFEDVRRHSRKKIVLIPKNKSQELYIESLEDPEARIVFAVGPAGTGKAQPLDAKVLTPSGWTTMGNLSVGDIVSTPDGETSAILGIYPQGEKDIYKITFEDGRSTECCKEHLWNVYYNNWASKWKTIDTEELISRLNKNKKSNYYIQLCIQENSYKNYNIEPYMMGLLLGNGNLSKNLSFTSSDDELVNYMNESLKEGYTLIQQSKYDFLIVKNKNEQYKTENQKDVFENEYKQYIYNFGLMGCLSDSKFIPSEYFEGSYNQRLSLLQGIMDTNGIVNKSSSLSYSTTSLQLATDVQKLVWSLGGICKIKEKQSYFTYKDEYKKGRLHFNLIIKMKEPTKCFRLSKKLNFIKNNHQYKDLKLRIKTIEKIGCKNAQCIYIDHPKHLYVTDNFITTHNTMLATLAAIKELESGNIKKIVITRPNVAVDDNPIGHLPGDILGKMTPWMMPILDVFKEVYSQREVESLIRDGIIEICPIAFMRGRTFKESWVLVDEAQGTKSGDTLKAILTRIGTNSKMIITGDLKQSDFSGVNGLADFMKRYNPDKADNIDVIEFKHIDIERDPVVRQVLSLYGEE